jgi:general secretion pathway protein G
MTNLVRHLWANLVKRPKRSETPEPNGYTFAEVLAVLLILGLIAAIVTPQVLGQMERAKVRAARLQAEGILTAVESMAADLGRLPTEVEGVKSLLVAPADAPGWQGPYMRDERRIMDPWGRPFLLKVPGPEGSNFSIQSLGSDGKTGGERGAADVIVN